MKNWKSQKQYVSIISKNDPDFKGSLERNHLHLNPNYGYNHVFMMDMAEAINVFKSVSKKGEWSQVVRAIHKPAGPNILMKSQNIIDKVMKIIPSLQSEPHIYMDIEGLVPDMGRVAVGNPECMLNKRRDQDIASSGSGSDVMRVIISTDNTHGGSTHGVALMALSHCCSLIQPCEFIVQQGWINREPTKNAGRSTVNMVNLPHVMDPSLLWFWCNSGYKDAEFSGVIAKRYLKTKYYGVSYGPELACDVFMQDTHLSKVRSILEGFGLKDITHEDIVAYWISKLISEKFLGIKDIDNPEIRGYIDSCRG